MIKRLQKGGKAQKSLRKVLMMMISQAVSVARRVKLSLQKRTPR